ncbi:hypothetical protein VNO80_13404 [Phaseolus coccineus]|uniref:Pentatricopeptide repeat-containing protein n=1 Tax=Phaseolus coccineus TaxID=3886 RepID=A0AAN9N0X3_PHACN
MALFSSRDSPLKPMFAMPLSHYIHVWGISAEQVFNAMSQRHEVSYNSLISVASLLSACSSVGDLLVGKNFARMIKRLGCLQILSWKAHCLIFRQMLGFPQPRAKQDEAKWFTYVCQEKMLSSVSKTELAEQVRRMKATKDALVVSEVAPGGGTHVQSRQDEHTASGVVRKRRRFEGPIPLEHSHSNGH